MTRPPLYARGVARPLYTLEKRECVFCHKIWLAPAQQPHWDICPKCERTDQARLDDISRMVGRVERTLQ